MAFFYADNPPVDLLAEHEGVVLAPERAGTAAAELQQRGVRVYAYVSIGEVAPGDTLSAALKQEWVLGTNEAWGTRVLDPAAIGWRRVLLGRLRALHDQGYRAFFLDTLDSFQGALTGDAAQADRWRALAGFIREIHEELPGAHLLLNRGFEILADVAPLVDGVVAESLFRGWDARTKRYVEVSSEARAWLLAKLVEARDRHGLQAISIEYVPSEDRALARRTAAEVVAAGLVPWVASSQLDDVGIGTIEVVPRKVIAIYDGLHWPDLHLAPLVRFAALPLEHAGYVLELRDVRQGLPPVPAAGSVAGVVAWLEGSLPGGLGWDAWVRTALTRSVRVALLGDPGTRNDDTLGELGLALVPGGMAGSWQVAGRDAIVGFEAPVEPRTRDLTALVAGPLLNAHLSLVETHGARVTPVVTGRWGGLALTPYVVDEGWGGRWRWVLDPFAFFEKAFAPEPWPVPDLTTESGRRIGISGLIPGKNTSRLLPEDLRTISSLSPLRTLFDGDFTTLDEPGRWRLARSRQTDFPRRLHPTVAQKTSQGLLLLQAREYERRLRDSDALQVVRWTDGTWELRHRGSLATVRVDRSAGWPDPKTSRGVAGLRELPQGRYVALAGDSNVRLGFTAIAPTISLVESSAVISRWEPGSGGVVVDLRGASPARLVVRSTLRQCALAQGSRRVTAIANGPEHTFAGLAVDAGAFTIGCR